MVNSGCHYMQKRNIHSSYVDKENINMLEGVINECSMQTNEHFENVVFRDLLAFSYKHNAQVMHYHDDYGLEIDAVYQLENGDYALIEIKTGTSKIKEAESNLLKFKELIKTYNETHDVPYRLPNAMIIISGTQEVALTLNSGVIVIPIGCLKD